MGVCPPHRLWLARDWGGDQINRNKYGPGSGHNGEPRGGAQGHKGQEALLGCPAQQGGGFHSHPGFCSGTFPTL